LPSLMLGVRVLASVGADHSVGSIDSPEKFWVESWWLHACHSGGSRNPEQLCAGLVIFGRRVLPG
jgi:hypothetical protein